MVRSPDTDTSMTSLEFVRRYNCARFVYNLPKQNSVNIDRSFKRKYIYTKKGRSWWYSIETITDTNYSDDQALFIKYNPPVRIPMAYTAANRRIYSLPCKQESNWEHSLTKKCHLDSKWHTFKIHCSHISAAIFLVFDVDVGLSKAIITIDWFTIIWKSDQSDKIKWDFI